MKYKVIKDINLNGVNVLQGQTIFLSEGQAKPLVELGKIVPMNQPCPVNEVASNRAVFEPQELCRDDEALLSGKTAYRIWSELLKANIWLVSDSQAKAKLQADGVTEAVYTLAETQEFNKLPKEQRAYVHMVKAGLDGTLEDVKPVQEEGFKYSVLKTLEVQGKEYNPGDVIQLTVDNAQGLIKEGTIQQTCYWSESGDFLSEGY